MHVEHVQMYSLDICRRQMAHVRLRSQMSRSDRKYAPARCMGGSYGGRRLVPCRPPGEVDIERVHMHPCVVCGSHHVFWKMGQEEYSCIAMNNIYTAVVLVGRHTK